MILLRNLCVDFGSTFIKYFVFDGENIVFADRQEFPKPCVNDGVVYEISIENNFSKELRDELTNFIREDELTSENYVVTSERMPNKNEENEGRLVSTE